MLWMAIITPVIGAAYLVLQIHKRDLRGWQHYACVTSLIFLISIMLLIAGGRIESFGLAGNTVKLVDQKLDRIESLTEQNKQMAQRTVELVTHATRGSIMADDHDAISTRQSATNLLRAAGFSENEIRQFFSKTTNAP
jgi:hypothetical protein